jgi:hypothetical protein
VTRVAVVIDELVLVGFDPRDRHHVADALQQALERGLTRDDIVALLAAERSRPALGPIELWAPAGPGASGAGTAARRPETIGSRVGSAVAGAIVRATPPVHGGRGA